MLQDTGYNSMTSDTQNSHLSDKENKKSIIKNQNKQMINDTKKVKQERTKFTDIQKWTLNQFYLNQNRYPSIHEIERLGTQLNLSDAKIRVWFQNKRVRHRPDKKQLTDSSRFTITTSQQQSQTLSFMLSSLVSPLSPSVHLSIKQFYEQHQLHF
ncbi:unnamed protein product [Didymodactylos carnosus]|uniref:Homeobox domain-containing protein n=1 Tax=Didymodactylos carnosus TaxID=1234261 RepID=A0A813VFX3_9BILA|nr:unnamed protein product [Didymodactylos carnosus]CAF0959995.1 unnamed protein product [Didymodactylos carnosus]CAF3629739.1 unnamed protein product [Didymodactylos carnosus]CAF3732756.1 unnamed protein product [Didymodactylos carnosus]